MDGKINQMYELLQQLTTKVQEQDAQLSLLGATNSNLSVANTKLAAELEGRGKDGTQESILKRLRNVHLTNFKGDDLILYPARSYIYETQLQFNAAGIDPILAENAQQVMRHIMASLRGPAQLWAATWEDFKGALLKRFCPHDKEEAGRELFEEVVTKGQGLLVSDYNRKMLTARLQCPDMTDNHHARIPPGPD